MKKKLLIIALISCTNFLEAQKLSEFSSDSVKFIKELNDYFYDFSVNKKEAEEYVKEFSKIWKSPEFSSTYKKAVYKTCNLMLQRKLKPYPNFMSYLNAMKNYINSKLILQMLQP